MDEIVIRSMLKWPDVPSVYGWLALDRRGDWLIKTAGGRFDRVANAAVIEFIGRNYQKDAEGRWYFQNGPQRVFVALHYTPWVYRLDDAGRALVTQTRLAPRGFRAGWLDETGALLLESDLGIGVVSDRDLPSLIEQTSDSGGQPAEFLIEAIVRGEQPECRMLGHRFRIAKLRAAEVPGRFGFVPRPAPRPGEPEC
jgi:hypothetical protein